MTAAVALLVAGLSTSVLTSRWLGPHDRGIYLVSQTWATVVGAVAIGALPQIVAKVTARDGHSDLASRLGRKLVVTWLVLGGVVTVAVCMAVDVDAGRFAAGIVAMSAASALAGVLLGAAQGAGSMGRAYNLMRVLPLAVGLVAIVACQALEVGVSWWVLGVGVVQLLAVLAIAPLALGRRRAERKETSLRSIAGAVVRSYPVSLLWQLSYRIDLIVVTLVASAATTGLYGVAFAAGAAAAAILQSIGAVSFSHVVRRAAEQGEPWREIRRGVARCVTFGGVLAMVAAIAMEPVVRLAYGVDYLPAVGASRLLVVAAVASSVDQLMVHVFLAHGWNRRLMYTQVVTAGLSIGLLLPAVRSGSLTAVASVSVVVYGVEASALVLLSRGRIGRVDEVVGVAA